MQKRSMCNLKNSSRISTSKCHRKLTYKHGKEPKTPSTSESVEYSNVNVIETEVSLKENFASLIQKAKQESQKEVELRQMIELAHEKRLDQLLFSNGYIRQTVPSDGNCFFGAAIVALSSKVDAATLRNQLCTHLEDNMEEYVGFLMSKTRDIDDLTFIKSYCQEIDVLKQTGYWSNKAGDFLPLALSNWSKRPVRIYTSKHNQPIIEIQPTLGPVCNTTPLTLAYT